MNIYIIVVFLQIRQSVSFNLDVQAKQDLQQQLPQAARASQLATLYLDA